MKSEFMIRIGCSHLSIKKLVLLLPLFVSLAVSCKRDEVLDIRNTEYISFKLSDGGIIASGEVTKGTCDTLSYEISDWDYVSDESDSETKASLTTTLSGQSGIFGYNFTSWSSSVKPEVMYNMKGTFDGDELTPSTKVLWKNYTSGSVRFYAYSPYGKFTLSGKEDTGTPYLTYTVPTDNSKQIDILYAQSEDITSGNRSAVPLQFKHAMTAVQFRLGIDGATLKNVTVTGVNDSGKLFLDGTWSYLTGSASYSVANSDSLMIMIPQTVPSGATVSLTYNDGSADQNIKASIAGQVWEAGKKVVYTLKKKPAPGTVEYVYFDFTAGDIILTESSYSGYAYVTNKDSIAVKVPVKGKPKSSTKYYIYQSAPDSIVTAKGISNESIKSSKTGYSSAADIGKKNPTLPQYSTIEVNGKSWGEYITNNTDPAAVLAKWNSFPENFLEPDTPHRILIKSVKECEFDVTLDRVYSRYYPYRGSKTGELYEGVVTTAPFGSGDSRQYKDVYGGITIGQDSLTVYNNYPVYSTYKDAPDWERSYKEKVTLRLKGNNYFSRIEYAKKIASTAKGYLKITSEKGDGIAEGTLTVTLPYLRASHPTPKDDGLWNFVRCALIGGGANDKNPTTNLLLRQVKDLSFEGGIVYCGVEKIRNSNWKTNENMIPPIGTNNAQAQITIKGGIVTAVSNGTGPAIGGGAGWVKSGGKGIVTINGGTVYAYSFGVFNANEEVNAPVMSAAIGGGSSGNVKGAEGTVYINGGTVHAYSVGGCAIGGGTSATQVGGDGTVTIEGGNIFANSVSGNIGTHSYDAGVAIGGGRSGIESGNGGDANVTITGGTIIAGSIGGGKCGNTTGKLGLAVVNVNGGETSAQFLLVKDPKVETANTFSMTDGVIKNSKTSDTEYVKVKEDGGAVYMESGTCTISGGTISGCFGTLGGAVYMNGGTFNMSGGTIKNCKASTDGGGVYIEGGNVNLSGTGTIDHNIASKGDGGGVCIRGGNFDMTGGNVTGNSADSNPEYKEGNGGGIYVSSTTSNATVSITGGKVQYNASDRNGGGLCVDMTEANPGITANIVIGTVGGKATSPDISLNQAALGGGGMDVEGSGSKITINSGTVKGNVSAYVKNEDIRNEGGIVDLVGKDDEVDVNYKTIRFYANNGSDPEPSDDQRVITSTNSVLRPTATALAFKKDFYHLDGWNTKRDGTGTPYPLDGGGATMNITEDVALYGQWVRN